MEPLAVWIDEVQVFAWDVSEPKRGGTWLYCSWNEEGRGRMTWCQFRTKRWKTYRQHWRRHHR
jgi:hypothetical protein